MGQCCSSLQPRSCLQARFNLSPALPLTGAAPAPHPRADGQRHQDGPGAARISQGHRPLGAARWVQVLHACLEYYKNTGLCWQNIQSTACSTAMGASKGAICGELVAASCLLITACPPPLQPTPPLPSAAGAPEGAVCGELVAASTGGQISSRLLSLRSANVLLEIPQVGAGGFGWNA